MRVVRLSFTMLLTFLCVVLCGCTTRSDEQSLPPVATAEKPVVEMPASLPAEVVARYDLSALEQEGVFASLDRTRLLTTLDDPAYRSGPRTFVGYDLQQLLDKLDGFNQYESTSHSLRFVCKDGYRTTFDFSSIQGARGLVAVSLQGGEWDTYAHGKKSLTPDPFYLVWENEPISKKRPWPYQLTAIEIVSKDAIAARITPPEEGFAKGAETYKQYCMACHSMNLSGGEMEL